MTLLGEAPGKITPSYEPLSLEEEQSQVADLLAHSPEVTSAETKFAVVTLAADSPYSNLARSVESVTFMEFFNNDPVLMGQEYGPYEDSSLFFLVVDTENNRAAGAMRLLHPSKEGFKGANDMPAMGLTNLTPEELIANFGIKDTSALLEIATIAGAPDYRGQKSKGLMSAALYRSLYQYSNNNGYRDLIAVIDGVPLELLQMMHLPIQLSPDVDSPFEYLDAKANSFIHIPVTDVERNMKAHDPEMFEGLLGSGLDGKIAISHVIK